MAMASSSLHEYPFLTATSGGNLGSVSLALLLLLFGSGSQLEYFFHLFRFFGKSACRRGCRPRLLLRKGEMWEEKRYLDKHE